MFPRTATFRRAPAHFLSVNVLAAAILLSGADAASAQSLYTGAALVDGEGIDEVGFTNPPIHDLPPPPGLERMSVSQALDEHLLVWAAGDLPREGIELQVHAFRLEGGRVAQRYRPGSGFTIEASIAPEGDVDEVGFTNPPKHDIPLPPELTRMMDSKMLDMRVGAYALANEPVSVRDALDGPERFVQTGGFSAEYVQTGGFSAEKFKGDMLYFVVAPVDREQRNRARGTVMLVMF